MWVSTPELHAEDTHFLHGVILMERYVTITYCLLEKSVMISILSLLTCMCTGSICGKF